MFPSLFYFLSTMIDIPLVGGNLIHHHVPDQVTIPNISGNVLGKRCHASERQPQSATVILKAPSYGNQFVICALTSITNLRKLVTTKTTNKMDCRQLIR